MSDLENQNPNPEQPVSKEDKLKVLQELGIAGTDEKADVLLKLSHDEFDYLIEFNKAKVSSEEGKSKEQEKDKGDGAGEETAKEENTPTVSREKWDNEVVKRRAAENDVIQLKKQVKSISESLSNLVK